MKQKKKPAWETPASDSAMHSYKNAVVKRGLRYYAIIALCCLLPAAGFMALMQYIGSIDDTAMSKSIVQFAKAGGGSGGEETDMEKIGMLAGTGMEETADIQTIGEAQALVGNQGPVEYDEIPIGENPIWNYSAENGQDQQTDNDPVPAVENDDRQDADSAEDDITETDPDIRTEPEPEMTDRTSGDAELDSFYAWTSCSANVRTVPDRDSLDIIAVKHRGEKFVVIGENGDFWKVKWGTDSYAYIHKSCMTQTQP